MLDKSKKGIAMADYLSFFLVVVPGILAIFLIVNFFILPKIGQVAEFKIQESGDGLNEEQFLIPFLRSPIGERTMADLISDSYLNNDYGQFKTEVSNLFQFLYGREREWEAFIDGDKVGSNCKGFILGCSGKEVSHEIFLPVIQNKNSNLIKFELKIYK